EVSSRLFRFGNRRTDVQSFNSRQTRQSMNRTGLGVCVGIVALLSGCQHPTNAAQPERIPSLQDAERTKETANVAAEVRREHPDWAKEQVRDYVESYMRVTPISPETYAKTRAALDGARSLRCTFPHGGRVDLADPKLARKESAGPEVTFDAIDRKAGRARIITNDGAGDVTVIPGPTALTFIEVAPTGNSLVTVVFPRFRAGTREFYAADSEHIFAVGDISIGQYYGSCIALE